MSIVYLIIKNGDIKVIDVLYEIILIEIRFYDIFVKVNENEYVIFFYNVDIIKVCMIVKRIE